MVEEMTNKEAIELLRNLIGMVEDTHGNDYDEAFHMAIESLSKMDAKENYWVGCESCDRAMEDGGCVLWGDRMTEECGAWKEEVEDAEIH